MPADRLRLADRVQRLAARGLARLPAGVLVRLSGEPPLTDGELRLDPHVQLVRALRKRRDGQGLCEPTPEAGRRRYRRETLAFAGPPTPVGAVRDFEVAGPGGPLRLRHYAPAGDGPRPLTVYLHGGGFVIGDLDTHDEPCRLLCRHGGTHVLSVDYRLAPEHPFPGALEDARAALRWAREHAAALGADPARVAVGGDSAGGSLAAVAARLAGEEGGAPAAQLLVYPATDSVTPRPSQALFGDGFFLDQADRDAFSRHYLAGTGVDGTDPRVSPLLAPDLSGLPPALVVTAGFDLLRDEGEAYAGALRAAGSPARLLRVPGQGHGFIHLTGINPDARAAMVRVAREWGALLDSPPS
ncbi:MAG TPA: alpha/beta hydrolase [Longimicrobiaceae bacterium]|nr:alpha/beta hydrolase [Longimicrobiaceae bacterium]